MKLMGVKEYIETRYTAGSKPTDRQVIRLIRVGAIPGVRQGKLFYVDVEKEEKQTGDDLVDNVLS